MKQFYENIKEVIKKREYKILIRVIIGIPLFATVLLLQSLTAIFIYCMHLNATFSFKEALAETKHWIKTDTFL